MTWPSAVINIMDAENAALTGEGFIDCRGKYSGINVGRCGRNMRRRICAGLWIMLQAGEGSTGFQQQAYHVERLYVGAYGILGLSDFVFGSLFGERTYY